jgi:4-amino-4-deoxy-L-arabinose transferase-like glycosyltransferase
MAHKPFESRIQDLVYNVDVGIGLRLIKIGLYLLFVFLVMLLYTATQFKGFKNAEAMDYAQLGRNVMQHKRLITQNVRPSSLWYLGQKEQQIVPVDGHPDLWHAPVYPIMLGSWFTVTGAQFGKPEQGVFPPEYRIVLLNHIFVLLSSILLYLLARRLFDARIALLSVTVYFLSDMVWRDSISGVGITVLGFWALAAFYSLLVAVDRIEDNSLSRRWLWPAAWALVFCVLAFLTRYVAIALVPCAALYLGWTLKGQRGFVWGSVFVVVFLLAISPWFARNIMVSGSILGLAPHTALTDTTLFPDNSFERSLNPTLDAGEIAGALQIKWLGNMRKFYHEHARLLGDGLLICLFFTTFFYRFVRNTVHRLRWCILFSMVLLMSVAAFFGEQSFRVMHIFWPLIIMYGLAFFSLLLERLQLKARVLNMAVTGALIVLSALPIIFALLPPRVGMPYPPYFPGMIGYVSHMLEPEELMCTDMPWATAWYGQRTSLLLPLTVEEFYDINDYTKRVSGLYFTPLTRDLPFIRTLRSPRYVSWFPILEGRIPADFPLTQGIPLSNMEQLFLTDRQRWLEN